MSARLLRALQGGGVAAPQSADTWGIWRRPDRRSRMIGTLPGAEIDDLRCRGQLKRLGGSVSETLVWHGPVHPVRINATGPEILEQIDLTSSRSALEHLILNSPGPQRREAVRQIAMAYRQDHALALEPAAHVTMNWQRLQSGESARTGYRHDLMMRGAQTVRARQARARIDAVLSLEDRAFLSQLIVNEASKIELARRFSMRAGLIDAHAIAVLRRVADVYGIGFR